MYIYIYLSKETITEGLVKIFLRAKVLFSQNFYFLTQKDSTIARNNFAESLADGYLKWDIGGDQSCLVRKSLRANTRGKDVPGLAARNDRMCSSKREAPKKLPRRLSRITMEITTSLGSHTVPLLASFVGYSVSTSHLRYHTAPMMCVPSYSLLFCRPSARFRVRPKVKSCTCTSGYVRKRAIYLGSPVWFSLLEPRDLYVSHFCLDFFQSLLFLTPSWAERSLQCIV